MTPDQLAVAGAAVACAAAGLLVPRLIAAVPEPEPDDSPLEGPLGDSAADTVVEPASPVGEPASSVGEPASVVEPASSVVEPAASVVEPVETKEPYADIAALPGLGWRSAVAAGVSGGLVALATGADWALLFLLPLVPVSVALAVVDWRTRLLPTRIIAPTYVITIVLVLVCWAITRDTDDLVRAGWGWLVAGGLFFLLWFIHPRGLGYGDVRLSGVLGIALGWLGWGPLLLGVYAGFLLGGVGGGLLSLLRIVERRAFPFGPFMLVGALLGVLLGDSLLAGLAAG